ncbi:DMT family transporter [Xanthobacter tagetidis]|jgi:drug/metabolite transporter (DMT)-like permease|nr:DMT family transporter [Xanthobacter tagetidis]MBB6306441.1 drug/metabolite transporter (DMT)-like permease [Xanthobacter tagetidis]
MSAASNVRGMVAMIASMVMFITNDTLLKVALHDVPLSQALALRSLFAALLLLALVAQAGQLGLVLHAFRPRVLARSGLDTLTTFLYVGALAVMPIASTTTIYLSTPLITVALAVPLLGERVSVSQWCAVAVGFAGAVIVMRPDPETFQLVALLPLVAALSGSLRDIVTRNIGMEIPGAVVGVSTTLVLGLACALCAPFEPWRLPSALVVGQLAVSALTFALGTLLLVYAFRNAPVSVVSPLRYVLVFGAIVSGFVVFGELPDGWAWIGIVLVVGAGLYSIQAEHRRSRRARREGAAGAPAHPTVALAAPKD